MTKHEVVHEAIRKEKILATVLRIVSLVIAAFNILSVLFLFNDNEGFASIGAFKLTTLIVVSVVMILAIEAVIFITRERNERKILRLLSKDRT